MARDRSAAAVTNPRFLTVAARLVAAGLVAAGILLVTFMISLTSQLQAQSWSGILDPQRAVDWSKAGVVGGIPSGSWRQCGPTISAFSGAASAINDTIAACGTNQYVQLGAGTFNLSTGITWKGKSRVAVRGMGADQTFIVFTGTDPCQGTYSGVCMASADVNWSGGPSNTANWTAGYAKGATNITLSTVANLRVGAPLILDQADDAADTGNLFICEKGCSLDENNGNSQRTNRDQTQLVTVTGCGTANAFGAACNGTSVTISPGLYMPNWRASQSPGAWWASSPVYNDGIEDVSLDFTNAPGAKGIEIFNCSGCWVSGVRSIDSGKAHIEDQLSIHSTVQNNYLYLTQNSVDQSYGIEPFNASDSLYVNNIAQYVAAPYLINGPCSGCVLAYNFSINDYYTAAVNYVMMSTLAHTAGTDMLLFEGNIGAGFAADVFHGTHNFITSFRNYWIGNQPGCHIAAGFGTCSYNQHPVWLMAYSRYYNMVGNVLGQPGIQNGYESNSVPVYTLGSGNSALVNGATATVPFDPLVEPTLMRWGNYDTVNAAVRWVAGENGSGAPVYPALSSPSQTFPASFYYSSRPGWWPASKPWPLIGPDVSGGNIAGLDGHVNTPPAEDCYLNVMHGPADGTGPVLNFNAVKCYGTAITKTVAPQVNLTATVH